MSVKTVKKKTKKFPLLKDGTIIIQEGGNYGVKEFQY